MFTTPRMSYSQRIERKNSSQCLNADNVVSPTASRITIETFLAVLFLLAFTSCASQKPDESSPVAEQPTPVSTPYVVGGDLNLTQRLDALFAQPQFNSARWGMTVIRVKDGRVLYERNGDKLFTPASNMKVYTTAVALDLLGPDFRWRTSVYSDKPADAAGTINGDLVLYGRGAPDLVSLTTTDNGNSLEALAQMLVQRGVKRVRGNVVGDESYFRGQATGDGWQWNDLQWYYGAEASALSINANAVEIGITSASKSGDKPSVTVRDDTGYFEITNNLATSDRSSDYRIGVHKNLSDNRMTVWGTVPVGARGYGANLSVHDPAQWAARLFMKLLVAKGITVDGAATSRNSRVAEKDRFDPQGKTELAFVMSKSLGEIVRFTNKYSINLYAELILRTMGRQASNSEAEAPGREIGDEESGANQIRAWMSRVSVSTNLAIHDGSGLSRLNLVTPTATAQLLVAIQKRRAANSFMESLPVSGVDGTLQGRLASFQGRIHAKTGALIYDHSLSGYASASTGEWLAFSIMSNDSVGKGGVIPLIDLLAAAMLGGDNPPDPAKSPSSSNDSSEKH
jgi:D-alanyl-D-alanine carboxypeptidase/D-alanyl-D-alanine-endopeptidase (penicillin-binding protein 4)